jgi:hypothetical protein
MFVSYYSLSPGFIVHKSNQVPKTLEVIDLLISAGSNLSPSPSTDPPSHWKLRHHHDFTSTAINTIDRTLKNELD